MAVAIPRQSAGKRPIDFEHAKFDENPPAEPKCAHCQQAIVNRYFTVNEKLLCESCKDRATAPPGGSGLGRFMRAACFGVGAAAVGAGIWYAVTALTGYEFGLIAILVGFMVGAAVRLGSRDRGGLKYQLLAVFLTYTSIVSTNIPLIINQLEQQFAAAATGGAEGVVGEANAPATGSTAGTTTDGQAGSTATEASPATEQVTPGGVVLAVLALMALAYALPFLAGIKNLLGILIIGFGLWQAWRMNAREKLAVAGPFQVSAPVSSQAA